MAPKRNHSAKNQRAEETKRRKESNEPAGCVEANILFEYDHMMVVEAERRGNRFAGIVLRIEENIHATPYGLSSYQFELLKDSLENTSRQTSNPQKISSVVYRHADQLAGSTRRIGETENSESVKKQLTYEQLLRRNKELVDLVYRLRRLRHMSHPASVTKRLRTVNSKKRSPTAGASAPSVFCSGKKPSQEVPIVENSTRKRDARPISRVPSRISERIRAKSKEPLEEVEIRKKFVRGPSRGTVEHTVAVAHAVKASKTLHVENVGTVVSDDGVPGSTELLESPLTRQKMSKEAASKNLDPCLSTTPIIRRLAFLKANGEKLWCCVGKRRAGDVSANNAKRVRESPQKIDKECLAFTSSQTRTSKFRISSSFSRCVKFLSHSKRTCQYSVTLLEKGFASASAVFRETRVKLTKTFKTTTFLSSECILPASRTSQDCASLFVENVCASPTLDRSIFGCSLATLGAVELVIPCKDSATAARRYIIYEIDATVASGRDVCESRSSLSSSIIHQEGDEMKAIECQTATEENKLTCRYWVYQKGDGRKRRRKFSDRSSMLFPNVSRSEHSSTALQETENSTEKPDSMVKRMQRRGSNRSIEGFRQTSEECSVLNTVPEKALAFASLSIRESRSDVVQSFERAATSENVQRGFAVRWALRDRAISFGKGATGRMERIPYVFDPRSHSVRADHAYVKTPKTKETVVASLTVHEENRKTRISVLNASANETFGSAEQFVFSSDFARASMVSVKSNSVAERDSDKDEQKKFRGAFAEEPFDFLLKHPALLPEMVAEDNIATGSLFEVPPPEMESSSYAIATKGSLALENAAVAVNVAFDRHPHGKTSSQCKTATCVIQTSDVADVSETVCRTDIGANSVYDGSFARGTHTWQHRLYVGTICKSNTASNLVSVQSDCAKECFVPVSGPASDNFYENVMVSGAVARSEASQVSVSEHSRKFELPSVFRTPFGLKSGRFAEGGTPCTSDLLYLSQLSSRDAEEPRRAQSLVPMKRVYAPCSKQQLLARQSVEKDSNSLCGSSFRNVPSTSKVQADTTNESSRIGWQRNDTVAVVRANFESPVLSDRCAIRKWRNDSPRFNNPNQIIPYVIRLRPPGQSPRQDHTVVPSGDMGRSSVLPPVEELIGTERRLSEPMYRAARSPYIVYANYSGKKC